ncbi:MAG: DUF3576 domain-containing protein [Alphaproteobacteria bacterium]|jgi:hypothetical protein|nr:DUF3576 domain-containing protein [Alphaproteobacteria bacterium]
MFKYLLFIAVLFVTACSSTEPQNASTKKHKDGSFLTGRSETGITLEDISRTSNKSSSGIPVNALLWRASLDITSILPIDDIDVFSGTLITDWYSLPSQPSEQIKLAVFVLDKELRSDAIRVVVYVQSRQGNVWKDAGIDPELAIRLEDLILTRARELRASSVTQ